MCATNHQLPKAVLKNKTSHYGHADTRSSRWGLEGFDSPLLK